MKQIKILTKYNYKIPQAWNSSFAQNLLNSVGSKRLFFRQNVGVKRCSQINVSFVTLRHHLKVKTDGQTKIIKIHSKSWKKLNDSWIVDFWLIMWPTWTNQSACKYGRLPSIISLVKQWPIKLDPTQFNSVDFKTEKRYHKENISTVFIIPRLKNHNNSLLRNSHWSVPFSFKIKSAVKQPIA